MKFHLWHATLILWAVDGLGLLAVSAHWSIWPAIAGSFIVFNT